MHNRQKTSLIENLKAPPNMINMSLILGLFLSFGLACSSNTGAIDRPALESRQQIEANTQAENKPKKLDSYSVRGFNFSYYLVPKNLNHDQLIAVAQEIHVQESDAQLILVDDDSKIADYINYAKEISKGNMEVKFPKEWADKHIVGNVQKYLSGKWMLCEGNGYREIAELK